MSEKYKVIYSKQLHFITLTLVGWVDLFTRKIYTDILDESITLSRFVKSINNQQLNKTNKINKKMVDFFIQENANHQLDLELFNQSLESSSEIF